MTFVGILVGFFIYSLISNDYYMNKTEKKIHRSMTNGLLLPICFVCGVIGLSVGLYANQEAKETIKYGFDNAKMYEQKVGRNWVYNTKWINPNTNSENVIQTEKGTDGYLKTLFNGQIYMNHHISSAAKKIVYDAHIDARNGIWKKIKHNQLSQI